MSENKNKTYGAGGRIPSTGGLRGVQTGPKASLSSDCNVRVVDHLATLADNASSEAEGLMKLENSETTNNPENDQQKNVRGNEGGREVNEEDQAIFTRSNLTPRSPLKQKDVVVGVSSQDTLTDCVQIGTPTNTSKKRKADGSPRTPEASRNVKGEVDSAADSQMGSESEMDTKEERTRRSPTDGGKKERSRTSPRTHRTLSLDRERSSRGIKKRRAEESPQMDHTQKERATLWLRLVSKIANLRKLVIDNPTTKLEIKKNSEELQSLVTVLSNLEEMSDEEEAGEGREAQHTTVKSLSTTGSQTKEGGYRNAATQTDRKANSDGEESKKVSTAPTAEVIRSRIDNSTDFTQVKQLIGVSWPKSVYSSTVLCKGSILGQEADETRVILANEEKFSKSVLRKNLCAQVPVLKGKSTSSSGLLVAESKDSVSSDGDEGGDSQESRLLVIVGLVFSPAQDNKGYDEEDLYKKLARVRQIVEQKSKECLSLAIPEDADLVRIRKMIECSFANSQVKINLRLGKKNKYATTNPSRTTNHGLDKISAQEQTMEEGINWEVKNSKKKNQPQRKDNSIIVRQEGKSYSEILKAVKEGVNPAHFPAGARVTSIQRSRKEEVVIRVKGNGRAAENLCSVVKEKLPGFQANIKREKKAIVHISDLDGDTNGTEIKQGVKAELGITDLDAEEIEVTSLRPAFAGTQKATVKLSQSLANKLVKKKRILIGWISCRVKLREEHQRCYRCWEVGHIAPNCKGPDKSGLCFSCGEAGHQKATCQSNTSGGQKQGGETLHETAPT